MADERTVDLKANTMKITTRRMPATVKQIVNLEQMHDNVVAGTYCYYVVSLKNRVEPRVHSLIRQGAVKDLIDAGVDVNIRPPKS